jgi:hypothetical protein
MPHIIGGAVVIHKVFRDLNALAAGLQAELISASRTLKPWETKVIRVELVVAYTIRRVGDKVVVEGENIEGYELSFPED